MNDLMLKFIIFGVGTLFGFFLAAFIAAARDEYPETTEIPEWAKKELMEDDGN